MSSEEAVDSIVGQVLQETYQVTRRMAQGGMGAVFEAVHVRLPKKRYAIKVLLPSVARRAIRRFRREAEITSELGHPHIVDVHDFNETPDGQPYMVMEYLEGEDMGRRLQRRGCMPPAEVALMARHVGSALQAAHDHDVVHRDLKPANIFLVELERPEAPIYAKVLDFGISKVTSAPSSETGQNVLMGTAHYMSPEQANGFPAEIDHATDIFALGTICYQALCGELPFDAPAIPGVIYRIRYAAHRPLAGRVPGLPAKVDEVLSRALAKDRARRHRRISDFADQMARLLEGVPAAAGVARRPGAAAALAETETQVGLGVGRARSGRAEAPPRAASAGGTLALEDSGDGAADSGAHPSSPGKTTTLARDLGRRGRTAVLAVGALIAAGIGIGAAVGLSRPDEASRPPPLDSRSAAAPAPDASRPAILSPGSRDAAPAALKTVVSKKKTWHVAPARPPDMNTPDAARSTPPAPDAAVRKPGGFQKLHRPRPDSGAGSAGFKEL